MFNQNFHRSINMKLCTSLLLILLPVLSQGWEVAVGTETGLVFLEANETISSMVGNEDEDDSNGVLSVEAVAGDPSSNRIFFSISSQKKGSPLIMSTTVGSNISDPVSVVISVGGDYVQGLAYDEVGNSLYWTDGNRHAVLWANVSEGTVVHGGTILHHLQEEDDPSGIAVDPCSRLVFWTNSNHLSPSIERSYLNGTDRMVIVAKNIFRPVALALDLSGWIFWSDDSEGIHYKIEMSRFDGTDRTTVIEGQHHQPFALAFKPPYGKEKSGSLLWSDWIHDAIWQISLEDKSPKKFHHFKDISPMGLLSSAALHGNRSNDTKKLVCPKKEERKVMAKPTSVVTEPSSKMVNDAADDSGEMNMNEMKTIDNLATDNKGMNSVRSRVYPDYCLNGEAAIAEGRDDGGIKCDCKPGYAGVRCEISICHNFCIHGSCQVKRRSDREWEPKCECQIGFLGRRCDYNPCQGYCLNGGRCRIEGDGSPRCTCPGSGQLVLGERCERRLGLLEKMCAVRCSQEMGKAGHFIPLESVDGEEDIDGPMCKCPTNPGKYIYFSNSPRANISATEEREKFASSDSPFVLILGVLCAIFLAVSLYLAFKVFSLRSLPRIKKRIIVSKGAMPLAAGRGGSGSSGNQVLGEQQQCEITIENCCNMNICETPCFEPQLRSPGSSSVSNKTGKEEKKMLLANMEVPKSSCGPCQGADELY